MRTESIPPENWSNFFNEFNRDHLDWLVTIETMQNAESETLAAQLPFQGISFDTKGSRTSSLEISVGDAGKPHVAHWVHLPFHIRKVENPDGSLHVLIEPADGGPTIVHLRAPSCAPKPVMEL